MSFAAVQYAPLKLSDTEADDGDGYAAARGRSINSARVSHGVPLFLLLLLVVVAVCAANWTGDSSPRGASATDSRHGGGDAYQPELGGRVTGVSLPAAETDAEAEPQTEAATRAQYNLSLPLCPPARFLNELPERSPPSLGDDCPAELLPPSEAAAASAFNSSSYPSYVVPVHTFLISFPRSGNSMVRKILEDGTGVVTGSIYADKGLTRAGLRGEKRRANVLLLKHHFIGGETTRQPYFDASSIYDPLRPHRKWAQYAVQRYVYVVRNPLDAIVSWRLYLSSRDHGAGLDRGKLQRLTFFLLHEFLLWWLPVWAAHVRYFTSTFPAKCAQCSHLVVRYEEFVSHPNREDERNPTRRLLCFLGYPLHRGCRPDGDEAAEQPAITYRLKARLSLFNHSRLLPRTVSYTDEIFAALSPQQIHQLDSLGGAEMRAFGYWPLSL
jgi:hypothetical protein